MTAHAELLELAKLDTERTLRRVSPDLKGVPLYIACKSEVPAVLGDSMTRSHAAGAFHETLDLALQEHLSARDEWRGRGVAIYVNDKYLFRSDRSRHEKLDVFRGVCIHEFAHGLVSDSWPTDLVDTQPTKPPPDAIGLWCDYFRVHELKLPGDHDKRWHTHEAPFVRACLHLSWRLIQRMEGIASYYINFAGPHFGLSSCFTYQDALGDEPEQRAGEPIRDILTTDPPKAFTELWERDIESVRKDGVAK